MDKKSRKNNLKKVYILLFGILLVFVATAVLSSIVGGYIDDKYNIDPYGTIASLLVSYVLSVFGVVFYVKKSYNSPVS